MPLTFHDCGNNLYTLLADDVAALDATIDVQASGLDDLTAPFYADLGGEIVAVTLVTEDTPAPGTSRWTVTRAVFGSAGVYSAGIPVAQRNYAEQYTEIHAAAIAAWSGVLATLGGTAGVIRTATTDACVVSAGTGVAVNVTAGIAVVDSAPVVVTAGTVILAPPGSGTVNYQILVDGAGTLSAVLDTALDPAPAGYTILADVLVDWNDTGLIAGDINDRRSIL
jgi:hypothetical protein